MRWPKFARLVIALVILCAAAAATLLAVVPFIVSTDAIRVRVAQEISAWTGYSVELREAPRLKVFPVLRASLNGVTLSKMTEQGQKPFMSAARIDVELSPLDAIMGHISFSETQIVRPHVNLDGFQFPCAARRHCQFQRSPRHRNPCTARLAAARHKQQHAGS
jgi:AsmA protein